MSSFRKVVDQLNAQSTELDAAPCSRCQSPTRRSVLSHLGGRCSPCFEAYCAEPQPTAAPQPRRVPNVLNLNPDVPDAAAREQAKAEANRRVAEYRAQQAATVARARLPTPERQA